MSADHIAAVLDALAQSDGPILTAEAFPAVPFAAIKATLDRLGSREMITSRTIEREDYSLSEEAKGICAEGSHEAKVFDAVRRAVDGLKITDLAVRYALSLPAIKLVKAHVSHRVSLGKRAPRWARAKLLQQNGSRKMGIFSEHRRTRSQTLRGSNYRLSSGQSHTQTRRSLQI